MEYAEQSEDCELRESVKCTDNDRSLRATSGEQRAQLFWSYPCRNPTTSTDSFWRIGPANFSLERNRKCAGERA